MTRKTKKMIMVGNVPIGGGTPVSVQSMTNTPAGDLDSTLNQCRQLVTAGCEIIRISFPNIESTSIIPKLKQSISVPLVADIHFDAQIALKAIELGIDKLRINPGNIDKPNEVKGIAKEAGQKGIPIRVGVNSGSLPDDLLDKYPDDIPEALTEGALRHVNILEDAGFNSIVIAVKSTSVVETIEAYSRISAQSNYPLHLGLTEAGTVRSGAIRSAIALSLLLAMGIGDTIRVSLCGDPVKEVRVGLEILRSLGLREGGLRVIACPTCARTEIDVQKIAEEIEARLYNINKEITVAIMGCIVNGPGEAKHADIGIAGGKGKGILFKKGVKIKTINEAEMIDVLIDEIELWE